MDFVNLAGVITGVQKPTIHKNNVHYRCVVTYIAKNHKRHKIPVHMNLYNPTVFMLQKMKQHLQIGKYMSLNGAFIHKYINLKSKHKKGFYNNYVFAYEVMFTRTYFNINEVILNGYIGSKIYKGHFNGGQLAIEFYLITNSNFSSYIRVPIEIYIQNPQRFYYWVHHVHSGDEICVTNGKFRSKMFQSHRGYWYNMNAVFVKDDGVQVGKNHFPPIKQNKKIKDTQNNKKNKSNQSTTSSK